MENATKMPRARVVTSYAFAGLGVLLFVFGAYSHWLSIGEPHGYIRIFFVIPAFSIGAALLGGAGLLRWRFGKSPLRIASSALLVGGVGVFASLVIAIGHEMRAF